MVASVCLWLWFSFRFYNTNVSQKKCSTCFLCSRELLWTPLMFFPLILPQITDLRQRLAESQKTVLELEAEREQRQRDYDKKLLLAKSKIENVQVRRIRMHSWPNWNVSGTQTHFLNVSGREGVSELWDHWAEAESSLPAGSAAAPQQTAGVPGEGNPTAQQGGLGDWINTYF